MAEKDVSEKALISLNDVFADIVNGLLFQGRQIVREDMLTDASAYSTYDDLGMQRYQERDVAKYLVLDNGERTRVRIAFLGIENQTGYDPDMVIRTLNYDAAAYRAELDQEDRYPVITLVLYFGDRPWGKNKTLFDSVEIEEEYRPYVNDYRINLFEIAFLPEESVRWFHSDFKIVVDYFIHVRKDPDYRPKDPVRFQHTYELLLLMAALTHDHRFVDVMEGDDEGGVLDRMESILERAEIRGRAEGEALGRAEGEALGRAEGEARGRAEGEALGRIEGRLSVLTSLAKKGLLSLENAAKEADLSPEEFLKKMAELEQKV